MNKTKDVNFNEESGITLIALVITIVVLLILAGVSINMLTGENGILTQATKAADKTEESEEKEEVQLAVISAQLGDTGLQDLNYDNLQKAINESFGDNAKVIDNEDGTYTIIVNENRAYDVSEKGTIEQGINWELAMKNAKAPDSQDEERNNGVIGIETDGNPVDMDLWEYSYDETREGYGLNDAEAFHVLASAGRTSGYLGIDYANIIIPEYISTDNGKSYIPVTNMDWTFFNCTELLEIEKIPNTVKSMIFTFRGCNNLYFSNITLSRSCEKLYGTFFGCINTENKETPILPDSITIAAQAFSGCKGLIEVQNLPKNLKI